MLQRTDDVEESSSIFTPLSKTTKAIFLLVSGYGDAAHEVVLGVTVDNMDDGEYAATHPGLA
jgi:hypothetical protein